MIPDRRPRAIARPALLLLGCTDRPADEAAAEAADPDTSEEPGDTEVPARRPRRRQPA